MRDPFCWTIFYFVAIDFKSQFSRALFQLLYSISCCYIVSVRHHFINCAIWINSHLPHNSFQSYRSLRGSPCCKPEGLRKPIMNANPTLLLFRDIYSLLYPNCFMRFNSFYRLILSYTCLKLTCNWFNLILYSKHFWSTVLIVKLWSVVGLFFFSSDRICLWDQSSWHFINNTTQLYIYIVLTFC